MVVKGTKHQVIRNLGFKKEAEKRTRHSSGKEEPESKLPFFSSLSSHPIFTFFQL
jgi:hypothetical protein